MEQPTTTRSPERAHSPKEELDQISASVQNTMDRIYGASSFEQATPAQTQEVVKQVVDKHVETRLSEGPLSSNPFAGKAERKRAEEVVLGLSPDEDDEYIYELLDLVKEVGVVATLQAIDKTASFHIKDDLHRALVAYMHQGYPVKNLPEKDPLRNGLTMTLFELYLPVVDEEEATRRELGQLLSSMEQFYAGMRSVVSERDAQAHFSIEIALPQERDEIVIYVAVPDEAIHIFKNQILAIFPDMKILEATDDYNIFNKKEQTAVSVLEQSKSPLLSIKQYAEFEYDPLNIVLESFANLEHSEGASIQIMLGADPVGMDKQITRAIEEIEEGEEPDKALKIQSGGVFGGIAREFKGVFDNRSKEERERETQKRLERAQRSDRKALVEELQKKKSSYTYACNIRLVSAGNSAQHAQEILSGLEASFHQFAAANGNAFTFRRLKGREALKAIKAFTFRTFNPKALVYLNTAELTTLLHFHKKDEASSDMLSVSSAATGGASTKTLSSARGTSIDGVVPGKVLLGHNVHQGSETPIYLAAEDRLRHVYVIGQTGTGKTSMLKNMIIQDIQNGEGVCFVDPHGSDIEDIMANIPEHRKQDVVYFDPADTSRPMGMNMLEYDERYPEQKSFVVNELLSIFNKLFDMKNAGGPMFEQYFRNATLLVMEDPATGNTLLDIARVLSDENYRRLKLARCNNPVVKQFWMKIAQQAGGEASLENIVPYITSKFDNFLGDEIMRPIVAQEQSAFRLRDVMDNRKILLVNLSKGRLGEINANLLGLIFVGKILMAALSRVDAPREDRAPFYLYIDEFQNVTTDSISQILSEARKYGLSLNVAHQYINQLDEGIRDAVFGNVGNMITYRVSSEDAEFLEKVHAPVFDARDISNIDNYNAYVKMLVDGQPQKSFSLKAERPADGDMANKEAIKELSREKYGRPREEIEAEIMKKYQTL